MPVKIGTFEGQSSGDKETRMPVKIGTFGPLSEAKSTELQRQKARKIDPAMTALLDEIAIS
jgi:hypothetical protein